MPHASQHSMLEMDPPEHSKYRKIVSPEFTPRACAKIEPQIQRRVSQLLDNMESKAEGDFIEDFATPLPMGVFFDLMGVAEADHARVLELAERNFFAADPTFGGDKTGTACYQ
jgi:cytochrome P450